SWASAQHIYVTHAATRTSTDLTSTDLTTTDSGAQLILETPIDLLGAPAGTLPWVTPVQIDETGATANVFPWIAGGGADRADLVWYAGTGVDNNDPTNQWVVRYAQIHETNQGLAVAQTVASDHVMHVGQICEAGVNCSVNGNRDLLDFLEVTVTPDGRGAIAWSDDTASPPAAQIYESEQCGGVSATTGKWLSSTC
ncbi:MAG TPA: hypothetical protein VNE21_05100, partial [Mycobacteriales bacterium]|nr:hypothetical protein [Mycobacteriales bacterium]